MSTPISLSDLIDSTETKIQTCQKEMFKSRIILEQYGIQPELEIQDQERIQDFIACAIWPDYRELSQKLKQARLTLNRATLELHNQKNPTVQAFEACEQAKQTCKTAQSKLQLLISEKTLQDSIRQETESRLGKFGHLYHSLQGWKVYASESDFALRQWQAAFSLSACGLKQVEIQPGTNIQDFVDRLEKAAQTQTTPPEERYPVSPDFQWQVSKITRLYGICSLFMEIVEETGSSHAMSAAEEAGRFMVRIYSKMIATPEGQQQLREAFTHDHCLSDAVAMAKSYMPHPKSGGTSLCP